MDDILEIVASILKKEISFLRENMDSPGLWNSLTKVEIIMTMEEEFDITFEENEIANMNTLNDLVTIVERKR